MVVRPPLLVYILEKLGKVVQIMSSIHLGECGSTPRTLLATCSVSKQLAEQWSIEVPIYWVYLIAFL